MILGDSNGSPERRRVVFANLPREGGLLGVGGKYSEAIFAFAITELGLSSVGWGWKGVRRTAKRGELGYIPPGGRRTKI